MTAENISLIKMRDILLVTIPTDPDDATIAVLQTQVLQKLAHSEVRGLVLDISTLDIVDSFFARTLAETVQMVELMGGTTVITGMRSSVAITAMQLGLPLDHVQTALDVERALQLLDHILSI